MKPTTKKRIIGILKIMDKIVTIGVLATLIYDLFCKQERK